jgi:hypothetical protein
MNGISQLVFMIDTVFVFCEVRTELYDIIQLSFTLQNVAGVVCECCPIQLTFLTTKHQCESTFRSNPRCIWNNTALFEDSQTPPSRPSDSSSVKVKMSMDYGGVIFNRGKPRCCEKKPTSVLFYTS